MGKGQDRYRARWAKGKTGTGARWAKGKTGIGLDEHRATHTYMRLDGYRARQSLVGLSAHCANSYIPHVQHIIRICCGM